MTHRESFLVRFDLRVEVVLLLHILYVLLPVRRSR
jgi:hypothetical protein